MPTLSAMLRLNDGYNSTINRVVTGTDRATRSIEQASGATDRLDGRLDQAAATGRTAGSGMRGLGDNINGMGQAADRAEGIVKRLIKTVGGLAAIGKTINFGKDAFAEANLQRNADAQLKVVLANVGAAEDAFSRIQSKAAAIESKTIYGGDAMTAGAGEIATYISDAEAIEHMMGTLSNYAAGMSGGGEVDTTAMTDYATQLGKALDGTFDGLKKKGFELTEAQQKIIEKGSDMEKALVIDDVINQSWAGLAETMANLPENRIIRLKNAIGEIREAVGNKLTPALMRLVQMFETHLPTIEGMMLGLGTVMGLVVDGLSLVAEGVMNVAGFFIDNWSIISPIIYGIAFALATYALYLGIVKGAAIASAIAEGASAIAKGLLAAATWATTGATWSQVTAQMGLNGAMYACPIVWIVALFALLIAALYAGVALFNKLAGTSVSATGIITGAIAAAAAFVWNIFVALIDLVGGIINFWVNGFVAFANFFANFLNSPVSSIINLVADMADRVLGVLESIAKAMDTIFNSGLSAAVSGWRSNVKGLAADLIAEYAPDEDYQKVLDEIDFGSESLGLDRLGYFDSFNAGYDWGSELESKIGAGIDGLFDTSPYELDSTGLGGDLGSGGNPATVKGTGAGGAVKVENEEDIEWMRKLAERDYVARIAQNTLAPNIKVEFTGPITKEADVDGVAARMGELLKEQIATAPEGVYV
ncbi:MAG: hypothetical protein ACRDBO_13395 [Lachnospiraceae bacterium]